MDYMNAILARTNQFASSKAIEVALDRTIELNQGILVRQVWERWEQGEGVDGPGSVIGKYVEESYRKKKMEMNPKAKGFVDLTYTGALGDNLTLKKSGTKFIIYSTDPKYQSLGKKYGFKQFGVTDQQKFEFLEQAKAVVMDSILTQIYTQ